MSINSIFGSLLVKTFLATLFCFLSIAATAASADPFPLATGSAWVYETKVKWTADEKEQQKTITWTTEIKSVINRDNLTVAIGSGLPTDLCFYDEAVKPANFMFVKVGEWKLYVIRDQAKIDEIWAKAANPDEEMNSIVTEADLLLDLPLIPGKPYGETEQITRNDASYIYVTDSIASFSAAAVKGLSLTSPAEEHFINFRSGPDSTGWKFVPGVGFTGFFYYHNGTASEVECTLREVKK